MKRSKIILSCLCLAAGLIISCAGSSKDTAGPSAVMLTGATAKTTSVDITWTNPADAGFDHVEISWSLNGVPMNTVRVGKGLTAYSITGLVASTEYSITLVTVDTGNNRSALPSGFSIVTSSGADQAYHFIYTVADLNAVRGGVAGYAAWGLSENYILMADLDLNVPPYHTGTGWAPIGSLPNPFTGIFNGNSHRITNLFINAGSSGTPVGLFSFINYASIYNLELVSVNVTGGNGSLTGYSNFSNITNCSVSGSVAGSRDVGGLVGWDGYSTITRCSVSVSVTGVENIGGLLGSANYTTVTNCRATGNVSGSDIAIGGLVGYLDYGAIETSYATGAVSGTYRIGGLVGYTNTAWIRNSYARGSASGTTMVGGFAGESQSSNFEYNYATGAVSYGYTIDGGGFVGYNVAGNSYTYDYYDMTTTGQNDTWKGGQPRTTAQMKLIGTYQYWDFTNLWNIDSTGVINNGYPYLRNNHL